MRTRAEIERQLEHFMNWKRNPDGTPDMRTLDDPPAASPGGAQGPTPPAQTNAPAESVKVGWFRRLFRKARR